MYPVVCPVSKELIESVEVGIEHAARHGVRRITEFFELKSSVLS